MSPAPRTWKHAEFGGVKRPKGTLKPSPKKKKEEAKTLPWLLPKTRKAIKGILAEIRERNKQLEARKKGAGAKTPAIGRVQKKAFEELEKKRWYD